jgi:hypothetical protein
MNSYIKRYACNYKAIISDIVTFVGLFWLFVEIGSHSSNGALDQYTKNIPIFLIVLSLITIIALIKNMPKRCFAYKLRGKDNFIEIKVGDAFKNRGALVIPINTYFDVSLGGNVSKSNSLQRRLIEKVYKQNERELKSAISEQVDVSQENSIGTVIEVEKNNKIFYLVANSKKKKNNRVESTIDDFLLTLASLWTYIACESGRNSIITIPLIGTNHGRISTITRETAIKEIIYSYIDLSKTHDIADRLIISIYPDDLKKGNINLDAIEEYLKYSCEHYREIKFAEKDEGEGISASKVSDLSN